MTLAHLTVCDVGSASIAAFGLAMMLEAQDYILTIAD